MQPDVVIPSEAVMQLISKVDELVAQRYPDFEVCWYGHIGDGNLHLNILKPEALSIDEFYARCAEVSPEIFRLVAARGGSIRPSPAKRWIYRAAS